MSVTRARTGVTRLPPEILWYISELFLPPETGQYELFNQSATITIWNVCREWRNAIDSHRPAWRYPCIDLADGEETNISVMEFCLERAHNMVRLAVAVNAVYWRPLGHKLKDYLVTRAARLCTVTFFYHHQMVPEISCLAASLAVASQSKISTIQYVERHEGPRRRVFGKEYMTKNSHGHRIVFRRDVIDMIVDKSSYHERNWEPLLPTGKWEHLSRLNLSVNLYTPGMLDDLLTNVKSCIKLKIFELSVHLWGNWQWMPANDHLAYLGELSELTLAVYLPTFKHLSHERHPSYQARQGTMNFVRTLRCQSLEKLKIYAGGDISKPCEIDLKTVLIPDGIENASQRPKIETIHIQGGFVVAMDQIRDIVRCASWSISDIRIELLSEGQRNELHTLIQNALENFIP